MRPWLREPLLAFFLLGGLFFGVYAYLNPGEGDAIILDGAGLALLLEDYEALTGEPADPAMREAIIADFYRREVLYREGLREGVAERDGRLREAIIEHMQQRVSGELVEPAGRDLVNYYADHMDRYYREPTISVEQRFLAAEPGDAEAVLAALREGEAVDFDLPPGGALLNAYGESILRGLFGAEILERLRAMPLGSWGGPFETLRGWHFFRVLARTSRELQSFADARERVLADYQGEVLAERLSAYVDARRHRYRLVLPDPRTGADAPF